MPDEIEQAQLQAVRDALGDEPEANLAPRFSEEDKRQLFLAAKAAGLEVIGWTDCYEGGGYHSECHMAPGLIVRVRDGLSELWNPRDFDGDAFRLAVRIPYMDLKWIVVAAWQAHGVDDDRLEYVRRAIVSCAADIGANMQS